MRRRPFFVVAAAAALMFVSLPAQAAPAGTPITCGMVVTDSADLYLAKDLYCPKSDGVTIVNPGPEDPDHDTVRVNIDLGGHTLRGTTAHTGVVGAGSYPYRAVVTTTNGRVEGWRLGLSNSNKTTHVKLVGNQDGLLCLSGCLLAESYVNRNTDHGLLTAAENGAAVRATTFTRNGVGALVTGYSSWLVVTRSVLARNGSGVQLDLGYYTSELNSYRGNGAAVQVLRSAAPVGCFASTRDLYADNGADVVGTVC